MTQNDAMFHVNICVGRLLAKTKPKVKPCWP